MYIPKRNIRKARAIVEQWNSILKAELATVEPDLSITMEEVQIKKKGKVIKKALWRMVTQTIAALPHGVSKMSADIPGLVETSTNVAIIRTEKNKIVLTTSQRSSVASEIDEIRSMRLGGLRTRRSKSGALGRLSRLETQPRIAYLKSCEIHVSVFVPGKSLR